MMQAMYQVVVQLEYEWLLGGGRMPGYHKVANELSAEKYVESIISGKINDSVITFLLSCGRTPVRVIENYLEDTDTQ